MKGDAWWIVAVGLALGWLLPIVWEKVSPARTAKAFWGSLAKLSHSLVTDLDSDDFLQNYGRLLKLIGGYAGRNLLALAVAILPVMAFWAVFLTPGAPASLSGSPAYLELRPPQAARLTAGARIHEFSEQEYRLPFDFTTATSGRLESEERTTGASSLFRSRAMFSTSVGQGRYWFTASSRGWTPLFL